MVERIAAGGAATGVAAADHPPVLGDFEDSQLAKGTSEIAEYLAELAEKGGATTIIAGGDSVSAVHKSGLAHKMSHVSTGGDASLELLGGKELPGVDALDDVKMAAEKCTAVPTGVHSDKFPGAPPHQQVHSDKFPGAPLPSAAITPPACRRVAAVQSLVVAVASTAQQRWLVAVATVSARPRAMGAHAPSALCLRR